MISKPKEYFSFLLVHLLVISLALPSAAMLPRVAFAQGGDHQPGESGHQEALAGSPRDLAERGLVLASENRGDLPGLLSGENNNILYLLNQSLRTRSGEIVADLATLDLARQHFNHPPGVLERALEVSYHGNDLEISYSGADYVHHITFPAGEAPISIAYDNEYVFVLLEDGKRLTLAIGSLHRQLFNAPVPVFIRGRYDLSRYPAGNLGIRLVQRRNQPVDRSRRALRAALNRREDQKAQILANANAQLVNDLENNLEKVRYIPLSAAVAATHPRLEHGDVALVASSDEGEQIVDLESRAVEASEVENQAGALLGLLAMVHPDSADDINRFDQLTAEARQEIVGFLSNDERLVRMFNNGLFDSLALVSPEIVNGIKAHAAKVVTTSSERDSFTPEEWREDSKYFEDIVNQAQERSVGRSKVGRVLDQLALFSAKRTEKLLRPTNLRRLATALKAGSVAGVAVGADYVFNGGRGAELGFQLFAGSLHWMLHQFPVWLNDEYRPLLILSVASQAAIPALIYAASYAASRFTQLSAAQLPPTIGIRSFARLFQISPFRILSVLTRQKAAYRAMKMGYATAPVALAGEARVRGHQRINQTVRSQLYSRSLVALIALSTVAAGEKLPVGEVAARAEGVDPTTPEGLEKAMAMGKEIELQLQSVSRQDIAAELKENPQEFINKLSSVRRIVTGQDAGVQHSWFTRWKTFLWHSVALKVMQKTANYNEALYEQLSNALPDPFTCRLVNRGYVIDYLISLVSASSKGDWADLSNPKELHAQPDEFAWSHPKTTSENIQQSGIHLGRGSSTTYLIFSQAAGGANVMHQPAEMQELAEKQIPGVKPLMTEALETFTALFDLRNSQPGALAFNTMKSGRIRLFQSTLAIGVLPRLLFRRAKF